MTAGAGHRRAAEAIAQAVAAFPQAQVQCLDALAEAPRWFRAGYAASYLLLVRHLSWLWRISYYLLEWAPVYRLVQPFRRRWNLTMTRRFVARLAAEAPALVVATHFLPADVCSAGRSLGWLRAPLAVVVTDLHPHRFWISSEADAMVVSTEEGAAVLRRRGVEAARIHVVGIPIGKAFAQPVDRRALAERLRLAPGRQTVLMTSGGTTVGRFEQVVDRLLALEAVVPGQVQLLVVCGEDARARARLARRAEASRMPIRVFGFVEDMADLMAMSDLIVAKAGGLTVTEALSRGVPVILYHVIPGQEQVNAEYVARHGAGIVAPRPEQVAQAVRRLIEHPEQLAAMREAVRALSHPDAAEQIATRVLAPLIQERAS